MVSIFRNVSFIKTLKMKDEHLVDITANMTYRYYKENDRIIEYGEEAEEMYFILKGIVDVIKPVE